MGKFKYKFILTSLALAITFGALSFSGQSYADAQYSVGNKAFINQRSIELEFKPYSSPSLSNNSFIGGDSNQIVRLNSLLASYKYSRIRPLVDNAGIVGNNSVELALGNYYDVDFGGDVNVSKLVQEIKSLGITSEVYPKPLAAPSASAKIPDFTTLQQYLNAAPIGVDANYASTYPGGNGNRVRIVDIEYSWNTSHADLSKSKDALIPNGAPYDPYKNNDHGTAVIGEMVASNNGFGVTGISYGSSLKLINVDSVQNGWDPVHALVLAERNTKPGDVIVVEQQTAGPDANGDFVPVEWVPGIYQTIKALTDSGRIVLELAGNGGQNLNDSIYGKTFPSNKPDSGAIIVGAGENCSAGQLRSRIDFSDYGTRVNLQGPGDCVTTTGYGDYFSTAGVNQYYTNDFSGTSSATPVVAAAAASISSAYINANGVPASKTFVRDLLITTGTPQNMPNSGAIGPYPNLAAALPKTNSTPPSAPANLRVTLDISRKPILRWDVSVTRVSIAYYQIYRNGSYISSVNVTNYRDFFTKINNTYTYRLRAVDDSGNVSGYSNPVSVSIP